MEIFNSIWTALTTENEGLIDVILCILSFLEAFVNMLIFTIILNIKTNRKNKILYVLILSILGNIIRFFIPSPFNSYISMILLPILVFTIFKTNWLKAILSEFISIIVVVLLESIIVKSFFMFFGISYQQISAIPIYRIPMVLLIYLIIYILYLILKNLKFKLEIFESINLKTKILLISNSIIGIITIGTQFYLSSYYNETLPLAITLLSLLTLIAFFFINIFSLISITKLNYATQSLEESKLYNKTLQILHDNVRAFRHDFSNIVAGIGGYVQTNDMEGLKKYYSQLLPDCQNTNNLTTLNPEIINNPAVYNILANKYHRADEKGIKIDLAIFCDFNSLDIKVYELTRILGILLDNAIEASGECENKIINVTVRTEPKNNRQVLIIENTYNEKDVDTDKIYEKGYSTKQGNTGLGLWKVREILKKNTNLNLFTTKNKEYFVQQLEIYQK